VGRHAAVARVAKRASVATLDEVVGPKRYPAVPFSGRERRRLSRVAFPSEELGEQFVGALRDAVPEIRIFVGGRCATRYPAIAEQFGVHVCGDAAEAVAFLAT